MITVLSNIAVIYPLMITYERNDMCTFYCILSVALFSILSHSIEINSKDRLWYFLNKLDVISASLCFIRLCYVFGFNGIIEIILSRYIFILIYAGIFSGLGHYYRYKSINRYSFKRISEEDIFGEGVSIEEIKYDTYFKNYAVYHSLWHVFIFIFCGLILDEY